MYFSTGKSFTDVSFKHLLFNVYISIVGVFSLQTTQICLPNTSHFFERNIENLAAKDKSYLHMEKYN